MRAGNRHPALLQRVALRARWGGAAGAFFSVTSGIAFGIGGARVEQRIGTDIAHVILVYLVGCTIAGVIVGAEFPLIRWRVGAWIVGVVSFMPVCTGVMLTTGEMDGPIERTLFVLIGATLAIGSIIGYNLYRWHVGDSAPEECRRELSIRSCRVRTRQDLTLNFAISRM